MKKLMFAAAAAFCGTVFGLESANVVGYNKAEMTAGEVIYRVASFESIGSTESTFTIGDIKVGDADFAWWNNDYIATVDPYGSQETYYTWDPDSSSWYECDAGSNIDFEKPANGVALPLNKGIIVFSANGASLTFAGSVMSGDTELYGGASEVTYTGNFTPTELTLGDIVIGDADFAWWNNDYIATIDPYGSQESYYTWDPDKQSWYACDAGCNVDYDTPANEVTFDPNMGFIFFTANGASINIPSPL